MKITKEQLAAWNNALENRKKKNKSADVSATETANFVFNLSADQMGDIALELQPIINQYEHAYQELDVVVTNNREAPVRLVRATDLTEPKLTQDQRMAIFMGFHSGERSIREMAMKVLWMCNFRSLVRWAEMSYSEFEDRSASTREDDRSNALVKMYDLYERYDPFHGEYSSSFNHFAESYLPNLLKVDRLPSGMNLDTYEVINRLKSIRKNIAEKYNIAEEDVPSEDAIRQFSTRNAANLYTNGKRNKTFYKELDKLVEETGRDPDSFTNEEVEASYATFERNRISVAKYNRLVNFKNPVQVSIDKNLGDSEDDDFSLKDSLDDGYQLGYSEDILPPEQQYIKKEGDSELRIRLKKILEAIPNTELMLEIIMEYSESEPILRAQANLSKKGKKVKDADIKEELNRLFVEDVGSKYSQICGVDVRTSKRYAESALRKLTLLRSGHRVVDVDLIYDEAMEEGFNPSNKDLYDDLYQNDNKGLGIFSAMGEPLPKWNFAKDIDNRDDGAAIDFEDIFD